MAAVAAALAAGALPAQAQFYWPWQKRPDQPPQVVPAPGPASPAAPKKPAAPKPKQAAKPDAAKPGDGKGDGKQAEEAPAPPPPPYEPQLLRLSEIIGALAFLRPLCAGKDEQDWRVRMTELIEAEASTQPRKERLAGAFNRGFREYGLVYRRCTPAAELAINRFLAEAGTLTRELASRYGG
ncbi:TIGR02301 family protein [Nostoc sp. NIES-2111]